MTALRWELGGAVLSVYDENNFLDIQVDAPDGDNSGLLPQESHHPYGTYSVPPEPQKDANGALVPSSVSNCLIAHEGGRSHVIPLENPAIVALLPQILPGEKIDYGPKGQFTRYHADGAISMWIPGVDGGPDASYRFTASGIEFSGAMGTLRFTPEQFAVDHRSGVSLRASAIGGLPAPLNAIGNSFQVTAGTIDLAGSAVSMGPATDSGAVPHQPLAGATVLLAYIAEQIVALQAISAAMTAAAGVTTSGLAAGAPLVATAVAAISAPPLIMTTALASS
jgi:hypothetical protein